MRVHVAGLGKLGLPVALALEQAGHTITGWDISETRRDQILSGNAPEAAHEPQLRLYLARTRLELLPVVPADAEIVLVAVQTPHQPEFEGVTPLERPAQDFAYTWLRAA